MVKIRLSRLGKKNDPFYRIVAIDGKRKRSGKTLAVLGYWYPKKDIKKVNKKEIEVWLKKGAQLSETAKRLML